MSALTRAARAWLKDQAQPPAGITVRPIDVPSGRAVTFRTGVMHTVADAIEVSDGTETILAAAWLCDATSVQVALAGDDDDRAECAACRLAAALPQVPVVYYAWGEGDTLLYVGSTIKAHQRIRAHISGTRWWPEVKRLTFEECESEMECRRAEADAIMRRPGLYNRDGVPDPNISAAADLLDGIKIEGLS